MSDITVDPHELTQLADYQEQAADKADQGAKKTGNLSENLWLTHGAISGEATNAFTHKEQERQAAGQAIRDACLRLAATLRQTADVYEHSDHSLAQTHIHPHLRS